MEKTTGIAAIVLAASMGLGGCAKIGKMLFPTECEKEIPEKCTQIIEQHVDIDRGWAYLVLTCKDEQGELHFYFRSNIGDYQCWRDAGPGVDQ